MMLLLVVRLELAEYLRGRFELLRREALVTDDQHVMVNESPVQGLAVLRLDRLPKIEAGHLGAGMIRQRRNGERGHRFAHATCQDQGVIRAMTIALRWSRPVTI